MSSYILELTSSNFTLSNGSYYSTAFRQDETDGFVSVAVWLSDPGTASMQASMNGVDWVDVFNTEFTCANSGLQTYTDCHSKLLYRIKTSAPVTSAKIAI